MQSQRREILGANPTGGEASSAPDVLGACRVPGGGTHTPQLCAPRCPWHQPWRVHGPVPRDPRWVLWLLLARRAPRGTGAVGTPRRKCPRPESPGGCTVLWPRCSRHLRQGETPASPGRMCGARLAQAPWGPGGPPAPVAGGPHCPIAASSGAAVPGCAQAAVSVQVPPAPHGASFPSRHVPGPRQLAVTQPLGKQPCAWCCGTRHTARSRPCTGMLSRTRLLSSPGGPRDGHGAGRDRVNPIGSHCGVPLWGWDPGTAGRGGGTVSRAPRVGAAGTSRQQERNADWERSVGSRAGVRGPPKPPGWQSAATGDVPAVPCAGPSAAPWLSRHRDPPRGRGCAPGTSPWVPAHPDTAVPVPVSPWHRRGTSTPTKVPRSSHAIAPRRRVSPAQSGGGTHVSP